MDVDILSLFPRYFTGPFDESILGRARQRGILNIQCLQLRDFASGKHKKVDDRPYGGGPGMVLKPEPITKAIKSVKRTDSHVVYLSPQGRILTAEKCQELTHYSHLILLCGHYEGIDERIIENEVDEEISIGDYILTNGGLPAIVLIDALARFLPGVLGNVEAAENDSFQNAMLDSPHYTRPQVFGEKHVPSVLLSGNHAAVAKWREQVALDKMLRERPDMTTGRLEIVLTVSNLENSIRFYCEFLGFRLLNKTDERVQLKFDTCCLTLIEGVVTSSPLLRFVLANEKHFRSVASRLIGKGSHSHVKFGERELQLPFSDPNGYRWILVLPKGEKNESFNRGS